MFVLTPLGLLQLRGRFDLIAVHHLVSPLVRLAGSLLVWLVGGGLIGFLAVWLVSALAEWASMWVLGLWQLHRMALGVPFAGPVRGAISENEGLLPFIVATNVDITLRELAPRLVPLSIGWLLGPTAVGLYALAQRASVVLDNPPRCSAKRVTPSSQSSLSTANTTSFATPCGAAPQAP